MLYGNMDIYTCNMQKLGLDLKKIKRKHWQYTTTCLQKKVKHANRKRQHKKNKYHSDIRSVVRTQKKTVYILNCSYVYLGSFKYLLSFIYQYARHMDECHLLQIVQLIFNRVLVAFENPELLEKCFLSKYLKKI